MALCGFNLYRDQKRKRQQRQLLQLSKTKAAAVAKRKLSLEKAQQEDSSKKDLSIKPVGLSFDSEKKTVKERKIKKRIKKEV